MVMTLPVIRQSTIAHTWLQCPGPYIGTDSSYHQARTSEGGAANGWWCECGAGWMLMQQGGEWVWVRSGYDVDRSDPKNVVEVKDLRQAYRKAYLEAQKAWDVYRFRTGDRTTASLISGTPEKDQIRELWVHFFDIASQYVAENPLPKGYSLGADVDGSPWPFLPSKNQCNVKKSMAPFGYESRCKLIKGHDGDCQFDE